MATLTAVPGPMSGMSALQSWVGFNHARILVADGWDGPRDDNNCPTVAPDDKTVHGWGFNFQDTKKDTRKGHGLELEVFRHPSAPPFVTQHGFEVVKAFTPWQDNELKFVGYTLLDYEAIHARGKSFFPARQG